MSLLLDTHVLIWLMEDAPELRPHIVEAIDESAGHDDVFIPVISFWEISTLVSKGRVDLRKPTQQWTQDVLAEPGLDLTSTNA